MAFIPAPNIVMGEVRAILDSQKIENRFMFDCLTAPTPMILTDIAGMLHDWVTDEYAPLLPNAVSFTEVVTTDMSTDSGAQHTTFYGTPTNGGQASIAMPNEVSFCISLRSASRGRSARGRAYVLALPQPLVVGNTVNTTLRGQLVDAFNTLIALSNSLGRPMVVVSYRHNKVVRPGGPVYFPITTALSVDATVDSMRKRKPGVGT